MKKFEKFYKNFQSYRNNLGSSKLQSNGSKDIDGKILVIKGVARIFSKRNMKFLKMLATIAVRQRKFLGFGQAKTFKFGRLSMISRVQSCLSENLFFIYIAPKNIDICTQIQIFAYQKIQKMQYIPGSSTNVPLSGKNLPYFQYLLRITCPHIVLGRRSCSFQYSFKYLHIKPKKTFKFFNGTPTLITDVETMLLHFFAMKSL